MSTTIDHQVVEMRFDNKHFEQNVSTTMSTLDKFKQKLNMTDAAKGLENVNVAAKKVDLSSISNSADTVGLRFNALYTIADQAFRNITNSAYNAGKNIVKSLTIEPVTTGFNEYELKMGSIQTIMAGTGESLDTVNKYLNELNEYSDKTIYSFKDMTSNIGKFTNAGVSLEDAVLAIKGISNEAALSGANTNEASRAMYNFSQALSAGFVKLIDWKSIELANMATKDFKQQLIDTALEVGTLKEGADGMYDVVNVVSKANAASLNATKNFNDSLGNQWMTTEVLIETLRKYADETSDIGQKATAAATEVKTFTMMMDTLKEAAQSGWAQTWELFVGDFEEAKAFFTELSDIFSGIIGESADKRNAFFGDALTSNWDKLIDKINKAGIETSKFEEAIRKCYNNDDELDKLIKEHGSLEEAIRSGAIATEILQKAFDGIVDAGANEEIASFVEGLKEIKRILKYDSVGEDVKKLQTALDALGYDLGAPGIDGIIGPITEAAIKAFQKDHNLEIDGIVGPETLAALEAAGKKTNKLEGDVDDLKKSCKELIDVITKKGGRELLLESLLNIITAIRKPLSAVSKAFGKVFDFKPTQLYNLIENFNKLTKALIISDETAEKLQKTFEGVFSVFKIVSTIAGGAFGIAFKLLMVVLEKFNIGFLDLTANIGEGLKTISDFINDGIKKGLGATIDWLLPKITKLIEAIKKWIGRLKETRIGKEVIDIFENWPKTLDRIGDALDTCVKAIKDWIEELRNTQLYKDVSGWFGSIGNAVADSIEKIKGSISNFSIAGFSERFESLRSFFTGLYESLKQNRFVIAAVDGIKTAFGKVKDFFGKFKLPEFNLDNMKKWFDKLAWFEVSEDATGGGIKGFFTAIGDYFNGNVVKLKIRDFKESALQKFANFYLTMGDKVKAAFEKCREIMAAVAEFIFGSKDVKLPDIIDLGKKILEILVLIEALKALQKVVAPLDNITDALNNVATSLKWSAMSSMFKSMAIALGVFTICLIVISQIPAEDAKRSAILLGSLIVVLGGVVALIGWLAGKVDGGVNTAGAVASLLMLVGSIVILVYALKELDKLHLNNPLETFLKLFVVIMAMTAGVKMIGKAGSTSFRSVAAILTLMAALKMMLDVVDAYDKFEWGGKGDAVFRAIGMIVALSVAINLASRGIKAGSSAAGLALAIVAMVIALKVIITTIDDIAKIPPENIKKAAPVIAGILGFMTLLMGVANLTNKGIKLEKGQRAVNNFAGFAVALLAVVAAIWLLGKMALNNEQVLIKGGNAVGAILLAFTAMFTSIGLACSGLKMGSIWSMIAGIVIVIAALSAAIYVLRDVPWQTSISVAGAMALVIMAMGTALKTLVKYDVYSGNIGHWVLAMAFLALIVGGLSLVLKECKDVSWHTALGVASGLAIILGAIALSLKTLAGVYVPAAQIWKWVPVLAAMSIVVGLLAFVLKSANGVSGGNSVGVASGLAITLGVIALAIGALSKIPVNAASIWKWVPVMAAMSVVLGLVAFVLYNMDGMDSENAIKNATALSMLMVVLAGVLTVSASLGSKTTGAMAGIGALALLGLVVAELAIILGLMANFNVEPSIETATALSLLLLGMSGVLAILTVIGPTAPLAYPAMGALAVLIAGFAVLLGALGALMTYIPNAEQFLDKGIVVMENIGTAIGAFVGGLIGGIAAGVASSLPAIATSLSDFMANLEPFIAGIKNIDDKVLVGAGILAATILALSVADFITGILSLGGISLVGLGLQLSAFMVAAKPFIDGAKTLTPEILTGVKALAETILILTAANVLDGLTSWLTGGSSLENFAAQLPVLGQSLSAFSENLGSFTDDQLNTVNCAAKAVKTLASAAAEIPNTGGLLASLVGENDLGVFAAQFPVLGSGLAQFLSNIGTFTDEQVATVTCAAQAIKLLAEASAEIPNTGGLLGQLVGENDLGIFAAQFPMLGTGLAKFLTNVGTFTDEQVATVDCAAQAVKTLASAASEIPNSGGWIGAILGENDLGRFASQFPLLGTGLAGFLTNVGTFTDAQISTVECAASAVKTLAGVASEIPNEGGWISKIVGDNNLGTFASNFPSLGKGLAGFASELGTFTSSQVTSIKAAVTAIQALTGLANSDLKGAVKHLSDFGKDLPSFGKNIGSFCTNMPTTSSTTSAVNNLNKILGAVKSIASANTRPLATFAENLKKIGKDAVRKFVEAFTSDSAKTDLKNAAKKLGDKVVDGIEAKESDIKDAAKKASKKAVSGVETQKEEMKSAGKDLGKGLVKGIEAKWDAAYDAGYTLGQKAVQGEKDGQQSKSPSKLTIQAGKWLGEGLVVGMGKMATSVYSAGRDLGKSATDSLSSTISRIADAVNADIDAQPTIRPVLDLSDIKAGASTIGGLLGGDASVGVLANVGSISNMMNNRSQNGSNADIVHAIDKLSKKMDNVGNTTNIIEGVTYDDGSNIHSTVADLIRAVKMGGRA